jgi:hypothetical protein
MYDRGISKAGDILDIATEENIIEKRGAFYSYGEQRLAQGRENAKTYLEANPELMFAIENQVRGAKGLPVLDPPAMLAGPALAARPIHPAEENRRTAGSNRMRLSAAEAVMATQPEPTLELD